MTDYNVAAVRTKLLQREKIGLQKYGIPTSDSAADLESWLTHLQEELMDACVYIEAALSKLETAETEAHNKAVEACAEWLDREFTPHNMDGDFQAMRKALKQGPKP